MSISPPAVENLAASLLGTADTAARARVIAQAIAALYPDTACNLYRLLDQDSALFAVYATAGDIYFSDDSNGVTLPYQYSAEPGEPFIFTGKALRANLTSHLKSPRAMTSLVCIPVHLADYDPSLSSDSLLIIEMVSYGMEIDRFTLETIAPIFELTGPAIASAERSEKERHDSLDSIHRMSQLYDLEKSLNATLELDEVTSLTPEKVRPMLACQAVHLWLIEGDGLRLMATAGHDDTVTPDTTISAGNDYVADMAEEGTTLLIDDPEDPRLAARNAKLNPDSSSTPLYTALLVPLIQDEAEVGVLEAVNKEGGVPFDDDDQFFLESIAETVSSALKNATLMHAERKLEILETLVTVSSEITSTLRLDRLLQIIVNSPQRVLPYDRCSVALDNRDNLQLRAVSGRSSLPLGDAEVDQVNELVRWLAQQPDGLDLRWHEESESSAHLPEPVLRHFEASGNRALFSVPLTDDQGRVGLLLYEASDPDFLSLPHIEMIKILAGQVTVAIRNALLYREVPLISLLEPLALRKHAIFRSSGARRLTYSAVLAAFVLILAFCPWPMRIKGHAVVAPQHIVNVSAPAEGNVISVFAREGQRVAKGETLGSFDDWEWKADLASAEARYRSAQLSMQNNLVRGSPQAGADRTQAEIYRAEAARARTRIDEAQLRSPIDGIIATPQLQNAAGEHLLAGGVFAQVLDLTSAVVNIQVTQSQLALVAPGQSVVIKLDSYPQSSFHGKITLVSPVAEVLDGERIFNARVELPNDNAILRAGMTGSAKISVGYHPVGVALFRTPFLWLWHTVWNWIGW